MIDYSNYRHLERSFSFVLNNIKPFSFKWVEKVPNHMASQAMRASSGHAANRLASAKAEFGKVPQRG